MSSFMDRLLAVLAVIGADIKALYIGLATKITKGELLYNVKDYGAVGDGITDDTIAIDSAIAAMVAFPNTFGGAAGRLYFPQGRYITSGQHVFTNKRVKVMGAGPYNSIIYRKGNSTGDMLTFNGQNSGLEDITVDGNVLGASGGGDGVVLNAPYCYVRNATINNNAGNGISIGKASGAILHRLEGLTLRLNRGYGAYVFSGANTDGEWVNVDIGMSGLAGVRVSASAQQLVNVHVWGNGLEAVSSNDKSGFWLNSSGNMLSNCESETNLGNGILISSGASHNQGISNCDIWGNCLAAIYSFGGTKWHTIHGNRLRNNGVANVSGTTGNAYANIFNEAGREWSVSGNVFWDDGLAIPAGANYGYSPTNPYPGRSAIYTVSRHYTEITTSSSPEFCSFTGNVWRPETTRTGSSNVYVGAYHVRSGNVGQPNSSDGLSSDTTDYLAIYNAAKTD